MAPAHQPHPQIRCGSRRRTSRILALLGLAPLAMAADTVADPADPGWLLLDIPEQPRDLSAEVWLQGTWIPARGQSGTDASYDQNVYQGELTVGTWSDPRAPLPWAVSLRLDGHLRDHDVSKAGTLVPRLVINAPTRGNTLFTAGAATDTDTTTSDGDGTGGIRLLTDNTLPTRTMHRVGGTVTGRLDITPDIGLHARAGAHWSRSRGGDLDDDLSAEIGVSYRFHEAEALLIGATWAERTPWSETEDQLLPVLEWHAIFSEDFALRLGFPRMGMHWEPIDGTTITATWKYPIDLRLHARQELPRQFGLEAELWHQGHAFNAGANELLYDAVYDFYFFYPNEATFVAGIDNNLYIRESGFELMLTWDLPRWGIHVAAGPVVAFHEYWKEGRDRRRADTVSGLNGGVGGRIEIAWSF